MTAPETLLSSIDRAGHRLTGPRRIVSELVAARDGHFTAADLAVDARRERVAIGRATIFRALELFTELGLVERVDLVARPGISCGAGRIETVIGEQRYETTIPAGYAFGDLIAPLQVPDAGRGADARIHITAGACRREFASRLVPARKWKLYVTSITHLDIGYTARQPEALDVHMSNAKAALDVMERYPEYRWDLEGAWLTERYLHEHTAAEGRRLLDAAARVAAHGQRFVARHERGVEGGAVAAAHAPVGHDWRAIGAHHGLVDRPGRGTRSGWCRQSRSCHHSRWCHRSRSCRPCSWCRPSANLPPSRSFRSLRRPTM